MMRAPKSKPPKQVPLWLRRLQLVKAELKGLRFPHNAEEGFRQAVALSAASLRILRAEVRSSITRGDDRQVQAAIRRLLARLSHADARWTRFWKQERARCSRNDRLTVQNRLSQG